MELVLNNSFCELTLNEMELVEGGGWLEAGAAFLGGVLIGIAPAAGVATGIGAAVGGPVVAIAAGVAAYASVTAAGAACLDYACRK